MSRKMKKPEMEEPVYDEFADVEGPRDEFLTAWPDLGLSSGVAEFGTGVLATYPPRLSHII